MTDKRYYSNSTKGFYVTSIHGKNIPEDAIEISEKDHIALLEGQSKGQEIVSSEKGGPILIDRIPNINEEKIIKAEMEVILREMAIERLKSRGDLKQNNKEG
jgi:hypothetical protein